MLNEGISRTFQISNPLLVIRLYQGILAHRVLGNPSMWVAVVSTLPGFQTSLPEIDYQAPAL